MAMTIERLGQAVEQNAAIRRVQKLQPAGGPGDKIFPPTYPGERGPTHIFETRRVKGDDGEERDVRCVLIDSVQSQANRLEETVLAAIRAGEIVVPYVGVDFSKADKQAANGVDLSDLGEITSLDAPHRVFDAIISRLLKKGLAAGLSG